MHIIIAANQNCNTLIKTLMLLHYVVMLNRAENAHIVLHHTNSDLGNSFRVEHKHTVVWISDEKVP